MTQVLHQNSHKDICSIIHAIVEVNFNAYAVSALEIDD